MVVIGELNRDELALVDREQELLARSGLGNYADNRFWVGFLLFWSRVVATGRAYGTSRSGHETQSDSRRDEKTTKHELEPSVELLKIRLPFEFRRA